MQEFLTGSFARQAAISRGVKPRRQRSLGNRELPDDLLSCAAVRDAHGEIGARGPLKEDATQMLYRLLVTAQAKRR